MALCMPSFGCGQPPVDNCALCLDMWCTMFQLCPLALSILDVCYNLVVQHRDVAAAVWSDVATELRLLAGLGSITDLDLANKPALLELFGAFPEGVRHASGQG